TNPRWTRYAPKRLSRPPRGPIPRTRLPGNLGISWSSGASRSRLRSREDGARPRFAFVLGGVRTPVGRYGGSLASVVEAIGLRRQRPHRAVPRDEHELARRVLGDVEVAVRAEGEAGRTTPERRPPDDP